MIEPAEHMQPDFIPEAQDVAPKRRRRRTKAQMAQDATVTVEAGPAEAPKPVKPRPRAKKLTGAHVTGAVIKGSELAAMMTGYGGFVVTAAEMEPWAGEAAELLNRIPAQYVAGAMQLSSVAVVLYGMYMTFAPRVVGYQMAKAQAAASTRATVDPAHGEGVNGSVADVMSEYA